MYGLPEEDVHPIFEPYFSPTDSENCYLYTY
jgi:hypothetical protein